MNGNNIDQVPIRKVTSSERIQKIIKEFYDEFGCHPAFVARVPGRVNLIGEHIDYCGYPVLPMALEQDILVAGSLTEEHKVCIRNANPKYVSFELEIKAYDDITITADKDGKPFWYNYVLCGLKGALEHLNNEFSSGVRLYIDGNIPPASGLSSSSALVSAACLAFLYAQNATLNRTEIASLCARCERYIGTQGGGMDQAIAFLAEKYCAQYITWNPLKATKVVLPEDASFVVAHSLAEINKAATNDYNRRVIECRLASKILALSPETSKDHSVITLSQVQKLLDKTLEEMVTLVYERLPKSIYTKDEVCKMLEISEEEIDKLYLTSNTRHITEFKLKQRALHVYEEALRVEEFRKICLQSNMNGKSNGSIHDKIRSSGDENEILTRLGKLMSNSHESLKSLYECSHKKLDLLVEISSKLNVHSRLTGAGWGGCIVALCPNEKVKNYIEKLENEYYVEHCNIDKNKAKSYIFATTPNYGAVIYVNQ
ncbi:N-acetylgalactosamine kinase [Maniola jurtina]|uniref:N-acetylgalactosamine kinase n=1 Tax=Maniola jurtina TaxID=191418 RepID=UPI001E6896EA|nr:N-acetylgalactosamine kinase [Maniola jurtina]XP_045778344.1 N-acetylgalactosamine kinase [Maniola jurtina]